MRISLSKEERGKWLLLSRSTPPPPLAPPLLRLRLWRRLLTPFTLVPVVPMTTVGSHGDLSVVLFICSWFFVDSPSVPLKTLSLVLHSVLGGTPVDFHVTYLKDHHYRFSVASKQVGLAICALKRIISGHFDVLLPPLAR
jgi:hypothetical protein